MGDVISCAAVTTVIVENSLQSAFLACRMCFSERNASPRRRRAERACHRGEKDFEKKKKEKKEEEAKWSRGVTSGLLRIVTVPPACHSK